MKKFSTSFLAALFVFALAITASVSATVGEKRMTIEDSLAIKNVGAPQFAPDGKRIAYTLSEWDRKENRRVSHVYLASADGGKSLKLTNGEKGESAPQWSPDGARIAFLADRDKGAQIWIIPADGGEAEKLSSEDNGIQAFRWSPDGKTIAFVTRDTPKDKDAREKRKKDKFDFITVDRDLAYSHLWTISTASKEATKEKKRLTEGEFSVAAPQWSPDGKWIAYSASKAGAQESIFTDISADRDSDIFVIAATGGAARKLTTNPAPDANPQWSPDGKWIAYTANSDSWASKTDVMLVATEGGAPKNITAGFLESAGGASWSADGKTVYFTSGLGMYSHIYSVPVAGGEATPVTKGNRNFAQFDLSADGKRLAYLVNDSRTSEDIWVATIGQDDAKQITTANPQLKDFAIAETEVIKWKGPDNFDIEGLLMKPLGYEAGKKYPLILQIHGGPYGKFSDTFNSRNQIWAANGYAVLMPNPRGSTGYGVKFTQANIGDWGGKDFQDIMAGVDAVIAKGIADADKCVVMGGSYGGFMTFWTVSQTDRFKAAIGHAAISDWYSFHGQSDIPGLMEYGFKGTPWDVPENYRRWSPMTYVGKVKTPLMITHGERDFRVNIQQGEQYYRALKKRGVEVLFYRFPREGHGIQEPNHVIDLTKLQLDWFDSHLGIKREGREKPVEAKAAGSGTGK
ncbi:MAG TPA: S9 family peptidase [Blastocatellia bacterium]|nr:S9 family peptidase [Blastocatellia bacterium]HMY70601.1 S9 family peptidase [Blastocatellia bacterium]HMZ19154.1 S9 family peptidase [Blastocatellia bacterium]HNG30438.1 S9 family peptidase [Blastocatellia bacterium]